MRTDRMTVLQVRWQSWCQASTAN